MDTVNTKSLLLNPDLVTWADCEDTFLHRLTVGGVGRPHEAVDFMLMDTNEIVLVRPEHVSDLPDELGFLLTGSLVDLRIRDYDLPDDKKLALCKDLANFGVRVGDHHRLRRFLPMFSVLEPLGSHYCPSLPDNWIELTKNETCSSPV